MDKKWLDLAALAKYLRTMEEKGVPVEVIIDQLKRFANGEMGEVLGDDAVILIDGSREAAAIELVNDHLNGNTFLFHCS